MQKILHIFITCACVITIFSHNKSFSHDHTRNNTITLTPIGDNNDVFITTLQYNTDTEDRSMQLSSTNTASEKEEPSEESPENSGLKQFVVISHDTTLAHKNGEEETIKFADIATIKFAAIATIINYYTRTNSVKENIPERLKILITRFLYPAFVTFNGVVKGIPGEAEILMEKFDQYKSHQKEFRLVDDRDNSLIVPEKIKELTDTLNRFLSKKRKRGTPEEIEQTEEKLAEEIENMINTYQKKIRNIAPTKLHLETDHIAGRLGQFPEVTPKETNLKIPIRRRTIKKKKMNTSIQLIPVISKSQTLQPLTVEEDIAAIQRNRGCFKSFLNLICCK